MAMNSIKCLQPSVCNSLRSSIVLFDLPRIVEELTYNSVDSGATEVCVSVSVSKCQIKVEDDGCGITRDGLVILGERYATSKIHPTVDKQANNDSLGFRGETLASLADVSLLEVRTKTRGRANAYCKIMKGTKCLFFGIDDRKEAVGTTVIVRDLFHNQPVRRNNMETSPKKVLHMTKKCVLRIALVHPQVSFKVIDLDSEDQLLCTVPSSCPLPLVLDGFGDEISRSLHKIVFSDKSLMLSGYMSGLSDSLSSKIFQYIYVNSRFVCDGPIHNLINSYASTVAQDKVEPECHRRKRHRPQEYPACLINLSCPVTSYDLHFEPSKTIVEFKDWSLILSFFEQAIKEFWEQRSDDISKENNLVPDTKVPIGSEVHKEEIFTSDILLDSKMERKKFNIQLSPNILRHSPAVSSLNLSIEDIRVPKKHEILSNEMRMSPVLKPCQSSINFRWQPNFFRQFVSCDTSDVFTSGHDQMDWSNNIFHQLISNARSSLLDECLFSNQALQIENGGDEMGMENDLPGGFRCLREESHEGMLTSHPCEFMGVAERSKFPLASPTISSLLDRDVSFFMKNEKDYSVNYRNLHPLGFGCSKTGKGLCLNDNLDSLEPVSHKEKFCNVILHEKSEVSSPLIRECHNFQELDKSSIDPMDHLSFEEPFLSMKKNIHQGLAPEICVSSPKIPKYVSPEVWHLDSPELSIESTNLQGHTCIDDLRGFNGGGHSYRGAASEMIDNLNSLMDTSENLPASNKKRSGYQYFPSPKRHMTYNFPTSGDTVAQLGSFSTVDDGKGWPFMGHSHIKDADVYHDNKSRMSMQNQDRLTNNHCDEQKFEIYRQRNTCRVMSRRSSSAPPFYKGKKKFPVLKDHLTTAGQVPTFRPSYDTKVLQDGFVDDVASQPYLDPVLGGISKPDFREHMDFKQDRAPINKTQSFKRFNKEINNQSSLKKGVEDYITNEMECASATLSKWRTSVPQPTVKDVSHNYPQNTDEILSVCSGVLHLSSSSLVPQSIERGSLEDAKILLQLDRKFIPVVASGILVVIDQHAADERIRVEQLRQKVLSEVVSDEGISVAYLDSEKELVLPEMGLQLLQKHEEQIQKWGWICRIHTQSSKSFAKKMDLLKRHTCSVTLVAVPSILGVNLTDKDLLEFIDQLVETDGSSAIPPAVLRVLNNKACRGAIMFGDSLLPSECSLIVEELKATSLCFQCAHGRPTTVPLLNMASLHQQLTILEMEKGGLDESWHGLRKHAPSIERAQLRLESANMFGGG